MRLINTSTLELTYFVGDAPEYAILSHRWEEEEIIFEDVSKIPLSSPENPARSKFGFSKVMGTCALAANDGYEWVWIDSCCIDKSSSAELQESINSMFRWYRQAQVCYAYLSDVADESSGWSKDFEKSQWFTRGWTLQELLAPSNVEFYSADWSPIGTKLSRTELIGSITGIEIEVLEFDWGTTEDNFCAAQKFSWAAHRKVSKVEDSAYCLFGLFNVNMPLLYGEGEEKAFYRLQQAIYEETADPTLFLFAWAPYKIFVAMLASWTTRFCRRSHCLVCRSHEQCFPSSIPYSDIIRSDRLSQLSAEDIHYIRLVRGGVMIKLPVVEYIPDGQRRDLLGSFVAILPLSRRGHEKSLFGIVLHRVTAVGYVRLFTMPALVDANTLSLRIDRSRQECYTIYNKPAGDSLSRFSDARFAPESGMKIAHFEFSSKSFKPFDWRCETPHEGLVQTGGKASLLLPEQQNERLYLTVSFRSVVDQDTVGAMTFWYSMSKSGLHDISFSRAQRCLGRWVLTGHSHQSRHHMNVVVPIGRTGDIFRVIIRRISIPEHTWESVVGEEFQDFFNRRQETIPMIHRRTYQIHAGYRLYVIHRPKRSR